MGQLGNHRGQPGATARPRGDSRWPDLALTREELVQPRLTSPRLARPRDTNEAKPFPGWVTPRSTSASPRNLRAPAIFIPGRSCLLSMFLPGPRKWQICGTTGRASTMASGRRWLKQLGRGPALPGGPLPLWHMPRLGRAQNADERSLPGHRPCPVLPATSQ